MPKLTRRIPCYPMVEDRTAVVVKPNLAFWEWVNEHNQHGLAVRPKDTEGCVFLIPDRDGRRWLDKHWCRVLEDELAMWCRNLSVWPERSLEQFEAWFTVEIHNIIYDVGTKGLRRMHYPPRVVGPNEVMCKPVRPVIEGP